MARKKARSGVPRHRRMRRNERLQAGPQWIAGYPGQDIVRGYRRHFGVDLPCAVKELQLLGVPLDPKRVQQILANHLAHLEAVRQRKAAKQANELTSYDQDADFYYIAGYTSGGAPYGVTWEEMETNMVPTVSDGNHMAQPVCLRNIVDELESILDEFQSFIDRAMDSAVTLPLEQLSADGELEAGEHLGLARNEWDDGDVALAEAICESDDFIPLPNRYDIREWSIMEAFSHSRPDAVQRDSLRDAIRDYGAFQPFRRAVDTFGLAEEWYSFRAEALARIAMDFLESHGIPYSR